MKKLFIILFLLSLLYKDGLGQGINNKDPKIGMVGLSFSTILPTGGDGHIFDDDKDLPHGEYGLAGGIDYWKRYGKTYDIHLALDLKYQQYHFHYNVDKNNGQFRFLHLSLPASLHFPIPNYSYMFFKFGLASGTYFKSQKKKKQIAIIAKDTRLSGYTLEPALVSGLTSAGMHVFTLGPLPTNGLAMLTKAMKANMVIMITASHNPHHDN